MNILYKKHLGDLVYSDSLILVTNTRTTAKNMNDQNEENLISLKDIFFDHKRTLIAYMAKYFLRPEDVEDILQETYVRTLEASLKTTISSPRSYLFITARNLIFRQLKKQSKQVTKEIDDLDHEYLTSRDVPADIKYDDKQKMKTFITAAQSLPPQCKRVFLMRKLYGMSHRDISKELGISTSTVERHISNAIKRCRQEMVKKGHGPFDTSLQYNTRKSE